MRSDQSLENIFKGYHRVTERVELDGASGHVVHSSLLKAGQLEKVAQDHIQLGLQGRKLHSTHF